MTDNHDDYRDIPSPKTIEEAGELDIYTAEGTKIQFRALFTDKPEDEKQMIIFIRHFFCGACELYLQALIKSLPASLHPSLSIIGCGGHALITSYRTRNSIPSSVLIYADPERKVFAKLGMRTTTAYFAEGKAAKQPEYHNKSFWGIVFSSGWNAITSGPKAIKAGPPGQNGGVVVMQGGECRFVHRMRKTDDYLGLEEARTVLEEKEGQKSDEL